MPVCCYAFIDLPEVLSAFGDGLLADVAGRGLHIKRSGGTHRRGTPLQTLILAQERWRDTVAVLGVFGHLLLHVFQERDGGLFYLAES